MASSRSLIRAASFLYGMGAATAVTLASCSHEGPFQNQNTSLDTTFGGGRDRQLTLNLETDLNPAWLRDGSGVVYSYEAAGDTADRCLAILPPTGGTRRELPCARSGFSRDSIDAFAEVSPGPDGQVLFTRAWSLPGDINPRRAALQLGSLDAPDSATTLLTFPYTASNGHLHQGISHIRWLTPTRAVYLGSTVAYPRPCPTCPPDTVSTGIELVELNLSAGSAAIQPIPNTDSASSVDVGATSDEIYFTRNGDTRVYHMLLPGGTPTIVHDFGSGGIARDVAVFGNQLYAVVGGVVAFTPDSVLGASQLDRGGKLYSADLTSGTDVWRVIDGRLFKRPVVSPQHNRLVAESFAATIIGCGPGCQDTTVSHSSDLWLLDLP